MSRPSPSTPGSMRAPIRLFQSDFLERLTHTRLTTLVLFWLMVGVAALVGGIGMGWPGGWVAVRWLGAGVAAWMMAEYLLHRFIFHLDRWIPAAARFCFLIHGCHHADPSDASRDIMPPVASAPLMALMAVAAAWAFGAANGLLLFGAFCLSYLAYDVVHYGCHQWPMRGGIGVYLRRHHLLHHFRDDARHFGVTSPLWDWVFGTSRVR